MNVHEKGTFGYDLQYLKEKDSTLVVLSDDKGEALVIVSPGYQAKVFTSSAGGVSGKSLGFVNYKALDAAVPDEHMNGYGGENRFWIGPEGGQFSVYFEKGTEQVYDNWHTPRAIDTEAWGVVSSDGRQVVLEKEMEVTNYLGNRLRLRVDRVVRLITPDAIAARLNVGIPAGVQAVAYATENRITNRDDFAWTRETGTICIWMLDMLDPAPNAVTVVPFRVGDEGVLGKVATTDYFGEIPADRLKIADGTLYLKTDGKYRSKIGMTGKRAKAVAGNYDPAAGRLSVITFDLDAGAVYLNQEWNPAKDPLAGDALNAYNDGPLADGSIMGPFLELESVSPAAFLSPGQSLSHAHDVYHFIGDEKALSPIAERLLGVTIDNLKRIF
jgi:hypothetical protein